jgi:hypothetical protein
MLNHKINNLNSKVLNSKNNLKSSISKENSNIIKISAKHQISWLSLNKINQINNTDNLATCITIAIPHALQPL